MEKIIEKIVDQYSLKVDEVPATVIITKEIGKNPKYLLKKLKIEEPTLALLDEVKNKLIERITLTSEELLDEKVVSQLKVRFKPTAVEILTSYLKDLDEKTKEYLVGTLMHESLGLGELEFLLADQFLEEIVVGSSKEPVKVYHKKYGWLDTNIMLKDEEQILNYSNMIARRIGKQITTLNPLLDAHLLTGDRVNAVLYPIATKGHTITLRKFNTDPITVIDMLNSNITSIEVFALIWMALEFEMNMLVSGGTASGKCVIGSTPVYLPNGKIVNIGKLVENKFKNKKIKKNDTWEYVDGDGAEVLSLDLNTLKISRNKIDKFWRHKAPEKLYKIKTRSGREITTTGEHPFFTLKDGCLTKIKAEEIKLRDRIAVPNKLPLELNKKNIDLTSYLINNKEIYIENVKNDVKILKDRLMKKHKLTFSRLVKRLGYKKSTFVGWMKDNSIPIHDFFKLSKLAKYQFNKKLLLKNKTGSRTRNVVKIPNICPELSRFVSLVIGDGYLTNDHKYVQLSNSNLEILNEFLALAKNLFGVKGYIKYPKNRVTKAVINSRVLSMILNKVFEIPYGDKAKNATIPNILFYQNEKCIKAFVSGIIDCKGYISKSEIEISSISKSLLKRLYLLFLRIGITPTLSKKKHCLYIYGLDNFIKLKNSIELGHLDKINKLDNLIRNSQNSYSVNTIPNLSNTIKRISLNKNLNQKNFTKQIGINRGLGEIWEGGIRNPTLFTLDTVLDFVEDTNLKNVFESDIFWDEIIDIEILNDHNEKYVYDLTVLDNHNFLAGDIPLFIHNTSFLNACMPFIPTNHRIISIEDTRELYLPKYLYWTPLVTRPPNPEGQGQITMLDLLVNSLRMRPDRIILGEIRRKEEAEILFEAMHTGHSVYATVHADSSNETIKRLVNPPIEVPENLLGQVHLNVVMFRDRKKGIRRTYQISEFVESGEEEEGGLIRPNLLYRWNPVNDQIVEHMQSIKLLEQLTRFTGLSETEVDKDLALREKILKWMLSKNIRDVQNVGKVIREYYLNKDFVVGLVNKNSDPKIILEKND